MTFFIKTFLFIIEIFKISILNYLLMHGNILGFVLYVLHITSILLIKLLLLLNLQHFIYPAFMKNVSFYQLSINHSITSFEIV